MEQDWVKWVATIGTITAAAIGFFVRAERRMTTIEVGAQCEKERSREQTEELKGFISDVRTEVRTTSESLRGDIQTLSRKFDAFLLHQKGAPQ